MSPSETQSLVDDYLAPPTTTSRPEAPSEESGSLRVVGSLNERRRLALAEIDDAAFSPVHVKIALVAGAGFFTDAYDIFAITIASAMIGMVYGSEEQLSVWQTAGLKAATLLGNLVGQILFGWLADVLGRKRMYGVELLIMIVATFGQAVSGQGPVLSVVNILIVWRFILGIGVGGDYPLSAVITSEFASTRTRGRLMTAVFSSQGWGQLVASLVALVVVAAFQDDIKRATELVDYTWRLLIGLGCIPAVIALYYRLTIPETPRFTMDIDRKINRASRDIRNALLRRSRGFYVNNMLDEPRVIAPRASGSDFISYFSRLENFKVLFGTAYSWFALDVAFYMLTLDSSFIIARSIPLPKSSSQDYNTLLGLCVANIVLTLAGYIPGFAASFLLIDVWGRKSIQLMGFVILTILFWVLGFATPLQQNYAALTALLCVANFFQNFGPNTTTFIVPGEVFPTRYRCTAHGISAACGKLGAVISQFVYPIACMSQSACDSDIVHFQDMLRVLSFVMMTGVFSTLLIPETNQRTLEDLSNEDQERYITGAASTREPAVPLASMSTESRWV